DTEFERKTETRKLQAMQGIRQSLAVAHVAPNDLEKFVERNIDRNGGEPRGRIGRDRIRRRGGFARRADHVELAVVPPKTELGTVRRRGLVDRDVPVARIMTERQHLKRIDMVLF